MAPRVGGPAFLTVTIIAAVSYPDKRRPARLAYEFIVSLLGSLFTTAEAWTKPPKPRGSTATRFT